MCISPFWIANLIPLLHQRLGWCWACSTPRYMSLPLTQRNRFFLSELILQKTIYLLSNLCFCIKGSVFPITLWFSECLSGIHRGSRGVFEKKIFKKPKQQKNYVSSNMQIWFDFCMLTLVWVYSGVFQGLHTCDFMTDWMQKQMWESSCLQ